MISVPFLLQKLWLIVHIAFPYELCTLLLITGGWTLPKLIQFPGRPAHSFFIQWICLPVTKWVRIWWNCLMSSLCVHLLPSSLMIDDYTLVIGRFTLSLWKTSPSAFNLWHHFWWFFISAPCSSPLFNCISTACILLLSLESILVLWVHRFRISFLSSTRYVKL